MKKILITFKGTQSELLSIARGGIKSCKKYLPRFAAISTRYTMTFLDGLSAKIAEAETVPIVQNRRQTQVDTRIDLTEIANSCLANCQLLKGYIEHAAPKNKLYSWTESAGLGLYEKSAAYNWSSLQEMLNTGVIFINANLAVLTVKGFMPADFPAKFDLDRKNFVEMLDDFYEAEKNKVVATESKTQLYNDIYAEIISIFKDGQKLFASQEAIRRQFVYDLLLSAMRSGGVASIFGYITNPDTQQPVEGVSVYSSDKSYTAVSDANGEYEISQVATGTYTLTFEKTGYEIVTQTIQVKTGTAAKADIALKAVEFALKIA